MVLISRTLPKVGPTLELSCEASLPGFVSFSSLLKASTLEGTSPTTVSVGPKQSSALLRSNCRVRSTTIVCADCRYLPGGVTDSAGLCFEHNGALDCRSVDVNNYVKRVGVNQLRICSEPSCRQRASDSRRAEFMVPRKRSAMGSRQVRVKTRIRHGAGSIDPLGPNHGRNGPGTLKTELLKLAVDAGQRLRRSRAG
jgi:hypothetical protein